MQVASATNVDKNLRKICLDQDILFVLAGTITTNTILASSLQVMYGKPGRSITLKFLPEVNFTTFTTY